MSNPTIASIIADVEATERVARGRGSPACDHLAGRLASIRGELQQIAEPQPGADAHAAQVLAAHNEWRRFNGETGVPGAPEMGDPAEIGRAIDHVVSRLRATPQPPAEAQPVAWQHPDALPSVEPGQYGWFWVAVRRARNGRIYSFPATYLNMFQLSNERGDHEEGTGNCYHHGPVDEEEGTFPATGWHDVKEHSEYDDIFSPLLVHEGEELVAWCVVPDYGDAQPPAEAQAQPCDNQGCRDQLADLLLTDPESGEPCSIVSTLRRGPGGFQSFDVQSGPDAPTWRIEFRVSESGGQDANPAVLTAPLSLPASVDAARQAGTLSSVTPPSAPVGVEGDDSELVERVARAIATEGFGRQWDDFHELYVHDTDKSDLREYARAAISALDQQPAAGIFNRIRQTPEYAREMEKLASALGYQNAFHEVAAMLDIPSQPLSPKEVWETQMRPKLLALTSQQPAAVDGARPLDDWHEDDGPVVWWKLPVDEPAWIGTPLDSDWPGYHTHWTPHPSCPPNALAAQQGGGS